MMIEGFTTPPGFIWSMDAIREEVATMSDDALVNVLGTLSSDVFKNVLAYVRSSGSFKRIAAVKHVQAVMDCDVHSAYRAVLAVERFDKL